MGEDKKKPELTFKDFERMGEGVVKKAFKSFRSEEHTSELQSR